MPIKLFVLCLCTVKYKEVKDLVSLYLYILPFNQYHAAPPSEFKTAQKTLHQWI